MEIQTPQIYQSEAVEAQKLIIACQQSETTARIMAKYLKENAKNENVKIFNRVAENIEKMLSDYKDLLTFYEQILKVQQENEITILAEKMSFVQDVALRVFDLGQEEYKKYLTQKKQ